TRSRSPHHEANDTPSARLRSMRWITHGERELYASEWVRLTLVDVEVPGGARFEHHVVRMPAFAAGTAVHQPPRRPLLIPRAPLPRTGSPPAGGVGGPRGGRADPGGPPAAAAAGETHGETGGRRGPLPPLVTSQPQNGLPAQRFPLFLAAGARHEGEPTDPGE